MMKARPPSRSPPSGGYQENVYQDPNQREYDHRIRSVDDYVDKRGTEQYPSQQIPNQYSQQLPHQYPQQPPQQYPQQHQHPQQPHHQHPQQQPHPSTTSASSTTSSPAS